MAALASLVLSEQLMSLTIQQNVMPFNLFVCIFGASYLVLNKLFISYFFLLFLEGVDAISLAHIK